MPVELCAVLGTSNVTCRATSRSTARSQACRSRLMARPKTRPELKVDRSHGPQGLWLRPELRDCMEQVIGALPAWAEDPKNLEGMEQGLRKDKGWWSGTSIDQVFQSSKQLQYTLSDWMSAHRSQRSNGQDLFVRAEAGGLKWVRMRELLTHLHPMDM